MRPLAHPLDHAELDEHVVDATHCRLEDGRLDLHRLARLKDDGRAAGFGRGATQTSFRAIGVQNQLGPEGARKPKDLRPR